MVVKKCECKCKFGLVFDNDLISIGDTLPSNLDRVNITISNSN